MRSKSTNLLSGTEEDWYWRVVTKVYETGNFENKGGFDMLNSTKYRDRNRVKIRMRISDRTWVKNNIPSSIWWFTEVHHNWKDGGRMYLLSKSEHILKHREEREKKT